MTSLGANAPADDGGIVDDALGLSIDPYGEPYVPDKVHGTVVVDGIGADGSPISDPGD
jgi:hypothetical protein